MCPENLNQSTNANHCSNCGNLLSSEANCCSNCGTPISNDEPNSPKKRSKKKIIIPIVIFFIMIAIGIAVFFLFETHVICIDHSWSRPTCTEPAKCIYCGKNKGNTLGKHKWKKANCTTPKTCRHCDKTEGEPLGHDWTEATCIEPKTCTKCNITEGEPLGHDGEESEWDIDYDDATQTKEMHCIRCEQTVETISESVTTFVSDDHFTIYPAAFADRFEESSVRLNNIDYYAKSEPKYDSYIFDESNQIFYRIQDKNNSYRDVGIMSFSKSDNTPISVIDNYTENCMTCINILIEKSNDVSAVVYSAILAIDPYIGYSEAADVGQKIVDSVALYSGTINAEDFQGIDYNGINYLLCKDGSYHYLIISV